MAAESSVFAIECLAHLVLDELLLCSPDERQVACHVQLDRRQERGLCPPRHFLCRHTTTACAKLAISLRTYTSTWNAERVFQLNSSLKVASRCCSLDTTVVFS